MSAAFPIVAITGTSDYSTTGITQALQKIFYRERIKAVYISGSGFHRYDRQQMRRAMLEARERGEELSHFGAAANHLDKLETMFVQYATTGTGQFRYYLHSPELAKAFAQKPGTFTPWQEMDPDSDLLVYRGLHGAAVDGATDLSQYPDLLIGAVPSLNLDWMRRVHRDMKRGYSQEEVRQITLDRLPDYVRYIAPQFERTHINFQIVPTVDTSDPFNVAELPSLQESILVIHFQKVAKYFNMMDLLKRIPGAYMSRKDTLVAPGPQAITAIEIILMPMIQTLIEESRELRGITTLPPEREAGIMGLQGQLAGDGYIV